tara:strand:+ start:29417 stop:31054 length:1638 start_codon:yes stop_codon:yes gene_type:complete
LTHEPTCGEVIALTLYEAGIREVFGHPGGEILGLIDALESRGIRFILTGHEATAAFMAATVGRITGRPGICITTLGPGACNAVLGVGTSLLDRDPILAISARTPTYRANRNNKQNLPLVDLFTPITRLSMDLENLPTKDTVRDALSIASGPPQGPVFLALPSDMVEMPAIKSNIPGKSISEETTRLSNINKTSALDLSLIMKRLNNAKKAIAVVGIALDAEKDSSRVREFLQTTGIPYISTTQAKGIADENGDRYLGTIAPAAGEEPIIEWLKQSDCVLGIGFDPVEISRLWYFEVPLQVIAKYPVDFGDYSPPTSCIGNVSELLDKISKDYKGESAWTCQEIADLKTRVDKIYHPPNTSGPKGVSPYHLISMIQKVLPDDTIVTSDVGAHKNVMGQRWLAPKPNTFLTSNGLSSMGYGVGAAMGAATLFPQKPVVAVTGDGAFSMMVHELETINRTGIKPLIIVLRDASLAVIKIAQKARNLPNIGVDFAPVDWSRVSEGFGISSETVESLDGTCKAISAWLINRDARVLIVNIDDNLYTGLKY